MGWSVRWVAASHRPSSECEARLPASVGHTVCLSAVCRVVLFIPYDHRLRVFASGDATKSALVVVSYLMVFCC